MSIKNFEPCHYILEDGIHYFTIFDFSRNGAEDFIGAVVKMMNTSESLGLPMLVDTSCGVLPLGYVIGRFSSLYKLTPKPPQPFKIAVIVKPNIINNMIDGMIRLFLYMKVRIFENDERETALDWLRQK